MVKAFKPDYFLLGMFAVVFLAWLSPETGASGGVLHPEILVKVGIALIFFLHGMLLSFQSLKAGMARVELHLVIQAATYLLFPLLGLLLFYAGKPYLDENLLLGFFFLCVVPSTVSSSVAMTAMANGNVSVAVFNATLSSLIGIVLTPFWMSLVLDVSNYDMDMPAIIIDLIIWLVCPLIVGQLVQPFIGNFARKHKAKVNMVDRSIILLLIYTSFCDSFIAGVWSNSGLQHAVVGLVGVASLFAIVFVALCLVCNQLGVSAADRAAVVFCGTKKSLATGLPMAKLIFGNAPILGLVLLPLVFYHQLQLFVCAIIARRWAKEID